jgi:DNA transposition AAA+ family ATPase
MSDQIETELPIVATKEYRRFAEFCDACRRYRYIGLCYGAPGVGKTRSAREYARWDRITPLLPEELFTLAGRSYFDGNFPHKPFASVVAPSFTEVLPCRTAFYTPPVSSSVRHIEREVPGLCALLSYLVEAAEQASRGTDDFLLAYRIPERTELVIVDEANRLKDAGLEQMRDLADRGEFSLVLLGMPDPEKRLMRAPQLYSRVGFAHDMEPLSDDETRDFPENRWRHRVQAYSDDFTDKEAVATILRITRGNIRLIEHLMMQVEHVLVANQLQVATAEVVETAR